MWALTSSRAINFGMEFHQFYHLQIAKIGLRELLLSVVKSCCEIEPLSLKFNWNELTLINVWSSNAQKVCSSISQGMILGLEEMSTKILELPSVVWKFWMNVSLIITKIVFLSRRLQICISMISLNSKYQI